jgi:hypothetical protein
MKAAVAAQTATRAATREHALVKALWPGLIRETQHRFGELRLFFATFRARVLPLCYLRPFRLCLTARRQVAVSPFPVIAGAK